MRWEWGFNWAAGATVFRATPPPVEVEGAGDEEPGLAGRVGWDGLVLLLVVLPKTGPWEGGWAAVDVGRAARWCGCREEGVRGREGPKGRLGRTARRRVCGRGCSVARSQPQDLEEVAPGVREEVEEAAAAEGRGTGRRAWGRRREGAGARAALEAVAVAPASAPGVAAAAAALTRLAIVPRAGVDLASLQRGRLSAGGWKACTRAVTQVFGQVPVDSCPALCPIGFQFLSIQFLIISVHCA